MLQLQVFGGCLVNFKRLLDLNDTTWAQPLAELTGIAADEYIKNRNLRVKARPESNIDISALGIPHELEKLNTLYQELCTLETRVINVYGKA